LTLLLIQLYSKIIAFPNPVSDGIFIKAIDSNQIASVEIRNITGQVVYETAKIDGEGISVAKFVPGIYTIRIRNAGGTLVSTTITISR
jgi:hypothetical protein